MDIIGNLVELELTIKKVYLKLIEYEVTNNIEEYEVMKSIALRLIHKESVIFQKIIKDSDLLFQLDNVLSENLSQEHDTYDEMFLKDIGQKYEPLIMLRIYNRFNNCLIYLTEKQISEFCDEDLIKCLGVPYEDVEEVSMFNWNITNLINGTSSKLEYLFLNDNIEQKEFSKEDYYHLVHYKNLLVYSNPILEKYFLSSEQATESLPNIFEHYDNYPEIYQKIYLSNLDYAVKKNIYYIINLMLHDINDFGYPCSQEVMNTIYLAGIKANLYLLDKQEFKIMKEKIEQTLDENFVMLTKQDKIKEFESIKKLLEECSENKQLVK